MSGSEALLAAASRGWQAASLAASERALCAYAEKLTLTPWAMTRQDVEELRQAGFEDVAIHDAIQVIAYFNYINRVADAVHVDCEPDMPAYPADDGSAAGGAE